MKTSRFVIFTGLLLIGSLPAQAHTGIGAVHGLIDGLKMLGAGFGLLCTVVGAGLLVGV
jgi:urease accessory protein